MMRIRWTTFLWSALAMCAAACRSGPSMGPEAGTADARPDTASPDSAVASQVPPGFVLVTPGSFQMGSPSDEPGRHSETETAHGVVLTRPFIVKATEVTQGEWEAVMGENPAYFFECGAECPVEYVNWWEALAFCNALSNTEDLPPCYDLMGCTGQIGLDHECQDLVVNGDGGHPATCAGYRLPTEAEWEYAARAGTITAFPAGGFAMGESGAPECTQVAALSSAGWYCANAMDTPHPVATKQANPWGLHDTAGNVLEWVWDHYAPYSAEPTTDPTGKAGVLRVLRGGSWSRAAGICRSAAREALDPRERDGDTGLRPVRTIFP